MNDKFKFTFQGKNMGISTDFDNGSLFCIEESETDTFDCWPYADSEYSQNNLYISAADCAGGASADEACFTFHCRIEGCRGRRIRVRFHVKERARTYGGTLLYANPDFPVFSYDGSHWMRLANKSLQDDPQMEYGKIVSIEEVFAEDVVYLSFQYPYSNDRLKSYIDEISFSPYCHIEDAGLSTEGRSIREIVVTDPSTGISDKRTACFIGLQHCAELGAGWGLEGMVDFLLSDDPLAMEARRRYLFRIIPIINVDAVAEGRGRLHSTGKNLNREWEKPDPVSETASIISAADAWQSAGAPIDIFIDFHGFSVTRDMNWSFLVFPEGTYSGRQADEYQYLLQELKKELPYAIFTSHMQPGHAAGAAARRYNALSLTVDAYVYRWVDHGIIPDLSSHYQHGNEIWPLEDIKACSQSFIRVLMTLSNYSDAKKEVCAGRQR